MSNDDVERWRRWAISTLAWERAIAKARGKRFPTIRGINKINEDVQLALREHRVSQAVRRIETAVRFAHKCPRQEVA